MNAKFDSSLFAYHNGFIIVYSLIYVNGLIITRNKLAFVASIIDQLGKKISLKDLGPLHFFIGIDIIPTRDGLFLTQHKYICDILAQTSMDGAKDMTTPLSTFISLKFVYGSSSVNSMEYQRVIGGLIYLSLTRLDINFAF